MSLLSNYNNLSDQAFGGVNFEYRDKTHTLIKSCIHNVSDEEWSKFVRLMVTAPLSAVSQSNALGAFEIMPRRLHDLGLTSKLGRIKSKAGKTIWTAEFKAPMTSNKFLKSLKAQYAVFAKSMQNYVKSIEKGDIVKSDEMSLSGALAILHRAGPKGLETWLTGERFSSTEASYNRVAGVF